MWNRRKKELKREYLTKPSTDPPLKGGCWVRFFLFLTNYVDDFILVRVEQEPSDQTGLTVSASLVSDHVRKIYIIISPKNSTNWDTTVHALGHTINTHTMRNSITPEEVAALKRVAGEGIMAERTGRSQSLRVTEHYIKTLEYFVDCESGAALCMAAATPYQLTFERR